MARRKKATSWKVKVPFENLEAAAPGLVGRNVGGLIAGYSLQTSSGVWRKADGTFTARLVFRNSAKDSLVFTVRNIQLPAV